MKDQTPWDRIKQALKEAGFNGTQDDAARILGIKQPSVSEWKTLGTAPSLENTIHARRAP